ncbi:MAG: type II secretion system protein GspM [Gammaproteobacteria bacterium]|jgi:general secretion pathway protein M|nr:type II secretion system protein GspM [Gammaproteobacteria bacterium]
MQLLPDREQSKPLAIGMTALLLVLIYLLFFHWFVMRHMTLGDEISRLRTEVQRFAGVVARRADIEASLQRLNSEDRNDDLFLRGGNFDVAAADMTQRLKQIIATQADHEAGCQVISNRNVRPREVEQFEKVKVEVRMRCNLGDFVKSMHTLSSSSPLVLVDGLNIYQRYVPVPGRELRNQNTAELDIRFEMYGYLAGARAPAEQT